MGRAARALGRRELSTTELDERLARSRVPPATRRETLSRLSEVAAVDDERFARHRAELLAERGSGDALIRHDLERRGIARELVVGALAALEPEEKRADRMVATRGATLKTARYLATKGFSEESIENACAKGIAEDAPPAVP
jgi:SOS response regulatory protein OraA/RecX